MSLPFAAGSRWKAARPWIWIVLIAMLFSSSGFGESFTIVTPTGSPGQLPTIGTSGDGTNNAARFKSVSGLCVDANTNVYVTDAHALRKLAKAGSNWVVTTLAGNIDTQGPQDGSNNVAGFNNAQGLAINASGVLYVADTYNNAIRRVTNQGTNWVVTTIAGLALNPGTADGSNSIARFKQPLGIAVDASGTLFVADSENQTIRKIVLSGTNWVVTTIAGSTGNSGSLDASNTVARFNGPFGICVDSAGSFYVADYNNHTIRKGTLFGTNWAVTTIAGLVGASGSVDGTNTNARFSFPQGITADPAGNIYVSENGNNAIRKIRLIGTNYVVNTLAGLAGSPGSANGTGAAAHFNGPFGIGITASGNLFVADNMNDIVRSGAAAAVLEYRLLGNKFIVSWPLAVANNGYIPETASSLTAPWSSASVFTVTNGDTCFLANNAGPGSSFYRLRKP
jgi:sugar lactone lactonase YvrE